MQDYLISDSPTSAKKEETGLSDYSELEASIARTLAEIREFNAITKPKSKPSTWKVVTEYSGVILLVVMSFTMALSLGVGLFNPGLGTMICLTGLTLIAVMLFEAMLCFPL